MGGKQHMAKPGQASCLRPDVPVCVILSSVLSGPHVIPGT